ncbi:hypothetical protein ACFWOJ_31030 [Streptomyces sp. NPDC058439]|uniref:hypothetical protein n=1 Tax=Streptomyces sp. NPDC058439 TaxID=3346500 RepID=UPI0036672EF4
MEIVNRSGARASCIVFVEFVEFVEFVDGDGRRDAEELASASDPDAGQKSLEMAQGLGKLPGKVTCRIAKVSRYPAP